MKEQILELRAQGKTYDEIVKIVGCSKGTISYHCGEGQKTKANQRQRENRAKNPLRTRVNRFKGKTVDRKTNSFIRRRDKGISSKGHTFTFTYEDAFKKVLSNPICYLTGRKIDLSDSKSYHFDHIIPFTKGGENTLENLGLTCKEANKAKDDLSVEEFLQLCKEVLQHNGYTVTK